jgi:hypothetical protein
METIRIRDKHPGSTTLEMSEQNHMANKKCGSAVVTHLNETETGRTYEGAGRLGATAGRLGTTAGRLGDAPTAGRLGDAPTTGRLGDATTAVRPHQFFYGRDEAAS